MKRFYSHGKLLLTAEYVVLDGAKALALPTKFGQSLEIESINQSKLLWQSFDYKNNIWFEANYTLGHGTINLNKTNNETIALKLLEILSAAKQLNPMFLSENNGFKAIAKLEFPNDWGLGSSSTLLNNIAQWALVDAFNLSNATFGGSGYDIACAKNDTAIAYSIINNKPKIERISFNKSFENNLFFVHLNRKQNSRDSIKTYNNNKSNSASTIEKINAISNKVLNCDTLKTFETLISEHENLIGTITKQTPIKTRLFKDFKNEIKSLGGWNGDFVLATGEKDYVKSYFKNKGYTTILDYKDMVL